MDSRYVRQAVFTSDQFTEYKKDNFCPICLETFGARKVSITPCKHTYHQKCLGEWMQFKKNGGYAVTCPGCRNTIQNKPKPVAIENRLTPAAINNRPRNKGPSCCLICCLMCLHETVRFALIFIALGAFIGIMAFILFKIIH